MILRKVSLFPFFFLFVLMSSCEKYKTDLQSPSKNLEVKIYTNEEGLKLNLIKSQKSILNIDLGILRMGKNLLGNTYQIEQIKQSSKDEVWTPVYGERSIVRNNYHEVKLSLKEKDSDKSIQLICRLYDEGVAFRYLFDETSFADVILDKELTSFDFDEDYEAWVTNRAQGEYQKKPISSIEEACERPLVIKRNDSSWLAIGEAALVDYARMKLKGHQEKENALQVELEGTVDLKIANYQTPWRYVMVAGSPGELLENNDFILNLNDPNKIEDPSWIKPGKVIREVTLTTQGGIACVDFAVKHNLQYVEFDAGWYGNEYDNASDASTITVDPKRSPGPLDLHHVIEYANEKGIGIILYINRRAMEKQLDEVLPLYKSWGIKGLKYGFVNVGPQKWTSWLHDAVRKAAEYELMVDIHDEYRPTGYSRTYPNLMTQEGIRGDEESPSTAHSLMTAFTRMIAGAGDNTNCYLASRVSEKMGGKAAQMAKAILLYSPWQFVYWYDRPENSPHKKGGAGAAQGLITADENLEFYDLLPTVWYDTQVLEGQIGEFATIARKNNGNWYVGSLVANETRQVNIPLSFLDKDEQYEATVYFQDKNDLKVNQISSEKIMVTRDSVFDRELLANSGLAVVIKWIEQKNK